MNLRFLVPLVLAIAVVTSGCLSPLPLTPAREGEPSRGASNDPGTSTNGGSINGNTTGDPGSTPEPTSSLAFAPPKRLPFADGYFEPIIHASDDGRLYLTATATRGEGRTRMHGYDKAAGLWTSPDGGGSWEPVTTPTGLRSTFPNLEGEVAVDAEGRLYYVGTNVATTTFARWSATEQGPTWEHTQPVQPIAAGPIKDRPWVAAHGDGIVYLVISNGLGTSSDLPEAHTDPSASESIWLHVSTDRGTTWSLGTTVDDAEWCLPSASPTDDTVHLACRVVESRSGHARDEVVLLTSHDRGSTWSREVVAEYRADVVDSEPPGFAPVVAHLPDGSPALAWEDDTHRDERPGRVRVAVTNASGGWMTQDITPFQGSFGRLWMDTGPNGTAAVAFMATNDTAPNNETAWFPYVAVATNAIHPTPNWNVLRLDRTPADIGERPPFDLFTITVGGDDRVHVAYHRERQDPEDPPEFHWPTLHGVFHVRQTAGPNLD